MSLIPDSDHAGECLDHLQTMLWDGGDHSQDDEISSIICMLQSPLFRQLLVLQDSITELEQVNKRDGLEGYEFSFLPELQIQSAAGTDHVTEPQPDGYANSPLNTPDYKRLIDSEIAKLADGRDVETIQLFKPENQSLGFSVVANPGDTNIYVQDIQPGGIAERHGGLRERDQLLAIDGQPLDISHHEAIKILQSARGLVEIVVARGPAQASPGTEEEAAGSGETSPEHATTTPQPQHTPEVSDMLNTEWTQLEVIDLINDGTGLGFGIIGGRSTGVVVKTILPGGVADVDGRLHSGDHILQIGDVDVRGFGSEQVAQVLRQAGSHVRLIVARPINENANVPTHDAPIVPTIQLDEHLEQILAVLENQMFDQMKQQQQQQQQQVFNPPQGHTENALVHKAPDAEENDPEVEYFDVTLRKDNKQGLGITIAGYVGRNNNPDDLCGIFVKSITPGSAAAHDGKIHDNDQIIEVDGQPLQGFTNHQAVEVLRNTGQEVNLKLARYQHGAKFEKLQQYLEKGKKRLSAQPQLSQQPMGGAQPGAPPSTEVTTVTTSLPTEDQGQVVTTQGAVDLEEVSLTQIPDDLDGELTPDIEAAIKACWEPIVGEQFEVVVAQLSKFKEGSGLGISLEGTVDVENGVEVRPHHYIRAILPDGPVGVNGRLRSRDELLEVNGKRLLGLNHKEVVGILKELPQNVRLVCARRNEAPSSPPNNVAYPGGEEFQSPPLNTGVSEIMPERLVKSKSDNNISSEPQSEKSNLTTRSRSLEPLTGLAMWSNEPVVIELKKGDKGLGFSILDYEDPVNPSEMVIVIRSLVPGGVAQLDGRLVPGDRLMFVNDVNLENATLDEAVQALKGAEKGVVRIGVAKPLPLSGGFQDQQPMEDDTEMAAESVIASFATEPMHAPVSNASSHNYMNLADIDGLALPTGLKRKESDVSSSVASDEHDASQQEVLKHARTESKDSFYESDKEELSFSSSKEIEDRITPREKPPLRAKPDLKPRPVPVPRKSPPEFDSSTRKQESIVSMGYENEEAIQLLKEHENAIKAEQDLPLQTELDLSYDYENSLQLEHSMTDSKHMLGEEQGELGRDSPEMFEYENSSLALPSYEEAVSGDAEFFDMDNLEAPPVPTRDDSHLVMASKQGSDTSFDEPYVYAKVKKNNTPQPSPRRVIPEKGAGPQTRPKPPVPPKPSLSPGRDERDAGSPKVQEDPPPLPFSSPPPLLNMDTSTKSSPGVQETMDVTTATRVEAAAPAAVEQRLDTSDHSGPLDISSSSDQFNTSDLKAVSSSSSTPRTASPGISPMSSPSLLRSFSGPDAFPPALEKHVVLKRSQNHLGMTVEATDKGTNGCVVKSLTKTGSVYHDGRIQVGDYIMSINNESMRRITNTQARVILRRTSMLTGTDISLRYVTAADGAAHKEAVANRPPSTPSTPTMMPSPNSTLSPVTKRAASSASDTSNPSSPLSSPRKPPISPVQRPALQSSPTSPPRKTSPLPEVAPKPAVTNTAPQVNTAPPVNTAPQVLAKIPQILNLDKFKLTPRKGSPTSGKLTPALSPARKLSGISASIIRMSSKPSASVSNDSEKSAVTLSKPSREPSAVADSTDVTKTASQITRQQSSEKITVELSQAVKPLGIESKTQSSDAIRKPYTSQYSRKIWDTGSSLKKQPPIPRPKPSKSPSTESFSSLKSDSQDDETRFRPFRAGLSRSSFDDGDTHSRDSSLVSVDTASTSSLETPSADSQDESSLSADTDNVDSPSNLSPQPASTVYKMKPILSTPSKPQAPVSSDRKKMSSTYRQSSQSALDLIKAKPKSRSDNQYKPKVSFSFDSERSFAPKQPLVRPSEEPLLPKPGESRNEAVERSESMSAEESKDMPPSARKSPETGSVTLGTDGLLPPVEGIDGLLPPDEPPPPVPTSEPPSLDSSSETEEDLDGQQSEPFKDTMSDIKQDVHVQDEYAKPRPFTSKPIAQPGTNNRSDVTFTGKPTVWNKSDRTPDASLVNNDSKPSPSNSQTNISDTEREPSYASYRSPATQGDNFKTKDLPQVSDSETVNSKVVLDGSKRPSLSSRLAAMRANIYTESPLSRYSKNSSSTPSEQDSNAAIVGDKKADDDPKLTQLSDLAPDTRPLRQKLSALASLYSDKNVTHSREGSDLNKSETKVTTKLPAHDSKSLTDSVTQNRNDGHQKQSSGLKSTPKPLYGKMSSLAARYTTSSYSLEHSDSSKSVTESKKSLDSTTKDPEFLKVNDTEPATRYRRGMILTKPKSQQMYTPTKNLSATSYNTSPTQTRSSSNSGLEVKNMPESNLKAQRELIAPSDDEEPVSMYESKNDWQTPVSTNKWSNQENSVSDVAVTPPSQRQSLFTHQRESSDSGTSDNATNKLSDNMKSSAITEAAFVSKYGLKKGPVGNEPTSQQPYGSTSSIHESKSTLPEQEGPESSISMTAGNTQRLSEETVTDKVTDTISEPTNTLDQKTSREQSQDNKYKQRTKPSDPMHTFKPVIASAAAGSRSIKAPSVEHESTDASDSDSDAKITSRTFTRTVPSSSSAVQAAKPVSPLQQHRTQPEYARTPSLESEPGSGSEESENDSLSAESDTRDEYPSSPKYESTLTVTFGKSTSSPDLPSSSAVDTRSTSKPKQTEQYSKSHTTASGQPRISEDQSYPRQLSVEPLEKNPIEKTHYSASQKGTTNAPKTDSQSNLSRETKEASPASHRQAETRRQTPSNSQPVLSPSSAYRLERRRQLEQLAKVSSLETGQTQSTDPSDKLPSTSKSSSEKTQPRSQKAVETKPTNHLLTKDPPNSMERRQVSERPVEVAAHTAAQIATSDPDNTNLYATNPVLNRKVLRKPVSQTPTESGQYSPDEIVSTDPPRKPAYVASAATRPIRTTEPVSQTRGQTTDALASATYTTGHHSIRQPVSKSSTNQAMHRRPVSQISVEAAKESRQAKSASQNIGQAPAKPSRKAPAVMYDIKPISGTGKKSGIPQATQKSTPNTIVPKSAVANAYKSNNDYTGEQTRSNDFKPKPKASNIPISSPPIANEPISNQPRRSKKRRPAPKPPVPVAPVSSRQSNVRSQADSSAHAPGPKPSAQSALGNQAKMKASPRQKETIVVGPGNQTWGPPRLVELFREPGKTLGISIVGGRVDMFHVSEEHMISGIFIKHVLDDSPAGRNGTLKTGDRILKVDGVDLRNATHDQAVETIRHASNPVKFVVQSLTDQACPRDLDTDTRSVQSYDESSAPAAPPPGSRSPTQQVPVEAPIQTSSPGPYTEAPPPPPATAVPSLPQEEEPVDEYGYSTERIQRRYGDLNGELLLVELTRGSSGLGISLAGNKDRNTMSVFVAGIQPDSAAGHDGRIIVGDELLEVNGNVLYGRSHLNASAIIKGLNSPVIKFVLLRRDDNLDRMAVKPLKVTSPVQKHETKVGVSQVSPLSEPATISPTPSDEKPAPSLSPALPTVHDVIQVISLSKGPSGLGFAIVDEVREGRQGIYVRNITYGGVADKDKRLSVGDQILEVQDKNLQDVHYDKAIEILRNSTGTVRLKVRKCIVDTAHAQQNNVHGQITLPNPGESSTDSATGNPTPEPGSHDPLTCPIIPGQETFIMIEKGRTGLGLSIVGGADTLLGAIIIHEVYEDGAAARDARLWAGDQILEVNSQNLREATHDYAIQVLRQTPATVTILVFRDDTHVKEEDIYDIFSVELIKKPGKGLGLSIVGKRNDVGVYISDIVKGGASEADGRLMQGDQILSVNGEDMRNATQEYAAAVLKTTMGKVSLSVGRLKAGSRTSSRKNSNSTGPGLRKSESTASNRSRGKHSKKGSEDMSHIRTVELEHDSNGSLGLSIAGGVGSSLGDTPILIASLSSGGPAERSRKLKVGDKILSINGVSTEGMNHSQVVSLLKSATQSVTLQVTQGEQTQVAVSGRSSSTRGSTRGSSSDRPSVPVRTPTPQENNVFEDEEVPAQYKTIVLERGSDGLGFSIVGGHGSPHGDLPIYVKNVFSKGAASENGQLKRGDQILSVNGTSLEGLTHEEAVNILKNAKGSVIMNVLS